MQLDVHAPVDMSASNTFVFVAWFAPPPPPTVNVTVGGDESFNYARGYDDNATGMSFRVFSVNGLRTRARQHLSFSGTESGFLAPTPAPELATTIASRPGQISSRCTDSSSRRRTHSISSGGKRYVSALTTFETHGITAPTRHPFILQRGLEAAAGMVVSISSINDQQLASIILTRLGPLP